MSEEDIALLQASATPTCASSEFLDPNTNECSTTCQNAWESVKDGACVNKCKDGPQPYYDKKRSICVTCDDVWHKVSGDFCVDKCGEDEHYNPVSNQCESCDAFWKKRQGEVCTNICSLDKSYNEYGDADSLFGGEIGLCVDVYQALDKVAESSALLRRNSWRIYGSLSSELNINCNGNAVYKTPLSERAINLQDY